MEGTRGDPPTDLARSEPDQIVKTLSRLTEPPAAQVAEWVWRRAEELRLTSPATFLELAESLLEAAERSSNAASVPDRLQVQAEIESSTTRGIAWCCYAEALNATGRIADAIEAYERATGLADRIPRKDILGQVLVGRVHVLSLAGRGQEAALAFRRAKRLLSTGGHTLLLGKLYTNWGNACYQDDRYREAFTAYAHADRLLRSAAPEDTTRAVLLLNQAIVAAKLERLVTAERLYERADAMGRELGLGRLSAFALFNWALLKQARADYRSALRLLERAGNAFRALDSKDMSAAVLIAGAEIYLDLGMPSDSVALARDAARLFSAEEMELDAVLAHTVEARCLAMLGDRERAIALLEEANAFFSERSNRPRQAQMLLHIAEAELENAAPTASEGHARTALEIFSALNMTRWAAQSRLIAARALLAAGRAPDAEAMIQPLLRRTAALPLNERQDLWALAGHVALARGDRDSASRRLHRAVHLLEAARRLIPGTELRAHRFARQVQVYHDLIELELHRPHLKTLLGLTERARARGFRDLASARDRAESKFGRQRVHLGTLTQRLEQAELGGSGESNPIRLKSLRRQLLELEREMLKSWRLESGHEERPPMETFEHDVNRLIRNLHPDEALLSYFASRERILVLVLSADNRRHLVLPRPASAIRAALARVEFQMTSAQLATVRQPGNLAFLSRACKAALKGLYDEVLAPVWKLLPERGRLTVIPHGFLHGVPFECLHDGDDYVDSKWVVRRLPLADQVAGRSVPPARMGRALLSGTVKDGPASVLQELNAVASILSHEGVEILGDVEILEDPTTEQLLARLPGASLAHIVTHGVYRNDNPLLSRLTTADGAVFLADLLSRRLSAKLVVLSACDTGKVFSGDGEDLYGLAHAFLGAGVRTLVASLWRVDDRATIALMRAFYTNYVRSSRSDAPVALRDAARSIRGQWEHPLFWGGFCVYGA